MAVALAFRHSKIKYRNQKISGFFFWNFLVVAILSSNLL